MKETQMKLFRTSGGDMSFGVAQYAAGREFHDLDNVLNELISSVYLGQNDHIVIHKAVCILSSRNNGFNFASVANVVKVPTSEGGPTDLYITSGMNPWRTDEMAHLAYTADVTIEPRSVKFASWTQTGAEELGFYVKQTIDFTKEFQTLSRYLAQPTPRTHDLRWYHEYHINTGGVVQKIFYDQNWEFTVSVRHGNKAQLRNLD